LLLWHPNNATCELPSLFTTKNKNTKGRHSSKTKTKNKVTIKKINKLEFIKKATQTNTSEWLLSFPRKEKISQKINLNFDNNFLSRLKKILRKFYFIALHRIPSRDKFKI